MKKHLLSILIIFILILSAGVFSACNGDKNDNGLSAYEIYIKYHPEYTKSEEEWITDLANGSLAVGELAFTLNADNSSYSVARGSVYTGTVTIPSAYNEKPVTVIAENAFGMCEGITDVIIPDSVKKIEKYAFRNCNGLIKVDLGKGVTDIDTRAFEGCSGLTEMVIPNSVAQIDNGAFSGCANLTDITIPFVGDKVKTEEDTNQYPFGYIFGESNYEGSVEAEQQFVGNTIQKRQSVTYYLPASLRKVKVVGGNILEGAFRNCKYLTNVTVPAEITKIGECAFQGCSRLDGFDLPQTVTKICDAAFASCSKLTEILLPEGLTSIDPYAFSRVGLQGNLIIPASVTTIGYAAFLNVNFDNIFCRAAAKPAGWETGWDGNGGAPISWGYTGD